jgi:sugar phosphate isomerase/epimerase
VDRSLDVCRRDFIRLSAVAGGLSALGAIAAPTVARAAGQEPGRDPWRGLKFGVASYSFHRIPLDATVKGIQRAGVHYVSIKDAHLPLKSTDDERRAVVAKFRAAGITPLSCGVITLGDDEAAVRNAFEYAREIGVPTMVCKPTRQSLPMLDKLVKEYDVALAIHNHGPEDKVWPSPYDVWEAVQSFDRRIGLCIDVGHTARCGVVPATAIRKCATRLFDLHLKDLDGTGEKAKSVEVGRGVLDIPGILEALIAIKYRHHVGLEHEKDMDDPLAGVAESVGFVRGALAMMRENA